jgi:hypothetical protein
MPARSRAGCRRLMSSCCASSPSGPGLAFHARAATTGDFVTALADLTGIDTPASADELVTTLAGLPGQSPVPVVLDALDEAASDRDRRQIAGALAELAVLPWLRVAVATRTMAAGDPFAPGGLLAALGVTTRDDRNLIDLDSDTYFDLEGLRQFAAALLAQDGMDRPGPPGAAWTQYRAQRGVRDRLAAVIAARAGRNFLVAAMAAVPLSAARTMTDPAAKGFDPAGIQSGVGEALSKYLDRLPDQRRERDRELLTALAYARGAQRGATPCRRLVRPGASCAAPRGPVRGMVLAARRCTRPRWHGGLPARLPQSPGDRRATPTRSARPRSPGRCGPADRQSGRRGASPPATLRPPHPNRTWLPPTRRAAARPPGARWRRLRNPCPKAKLALPPAGAIARRSAGSPRKPAIEAQLLARVPFVCHLCASGLPASLRR